MERARARQGILEKVTGIWVLSRSISEITSCGPQFAAHILVAATPAVCRGWNSASVLGELGADCKACHFLCHHLENVALFVIRGVWFYLQSLVLLEEARIVYVLFTVRVIVSVDVVVSIEPILMAPLFAELISVDVYRCQRHHL